MQLRPKDETGVIENFFVIAVLGLAILFVGSFAKAIISVQRYQSGLDLAVRNTIRDLVINPGLGTPGQVATADFTNTFSQMGLSLSNTSFNVSDPLGRCATISISAQKVITPFPVLSVSFILSTHQVEPVDSLASGLSGLDNCVGS